MSYIRLLSQRIPLTLWVGQVTSSAGNRLYSMGVLWLAWQLTGSAGAMSITAIAESVTLALVGMFAGAIIDRVHRLGAAILFDLMRGAIVLIIPIAHAMGSLNISILVVTGAAMGALDGVFSPAFESSLPTLVREDEFYSLAGLMDTPARFARMVGAGSAGLLLTIMSVAGFFYLDSVSFVISAISLGFISRWTGSGMAHRIAHRNAHRIETRSDFRSNTDFRDLWRDVKSGLRLVSSDARVLSVFIVDGLGNVAFVAYTLGGLLLATREFHAGLAGYGGLIAMYGVGSLVGNGIAGNMPLQKVRFLLSVGGWLGIGIGFIIVANTHVLGVAFLGIALSGVCGSLAHVSRATFMAAQVPLQDLGKAYSLRNIINTLASTAGAAACGRLLDVWPASRVVNSAGLFIVIMDCVVLGTLAVSWLVHSRNVNANRAL